MDNLNIDKAIISNSVFTTGFLDCKALYLHQFNKFPSISYIYGLDGEKAFFAFKEKYGGEVLSIHEYRMYERKRKQYEFDESILILNNDCLIDFNVNCCYVLHDGAAGLLVQEYTLFINVFKARQRKKPFEINLIVNDGHGLDLKAMEIKRTKLDVDLFYEDDFAAVDEVISARLNKKNDKGIVLLHGLPGTGKTTYLRYLIGRIRKKVLFLSPNVACDLTSPRFIDLLINNPNTVIVIEDAENIIMERNASGSAAVSNLLNISDGLLADFLNVQLVCTFNSSLTLVDSALLRKGRLIAKYEFGKLSVTKAQKLSDYLGFNNKIVKPMTVAEISNQHEKEVEVKPVKVIGFRAPSPKGEWIEN